jgi:hypothetical protein
MTDHIPWDPPPHFCSSWFAHRFMTQTATKRGHLLLMCAHCCRGGCVFDASALEAATVREAGMALPWPESWRVRPLSDTFERLLLSDARPIPANN